MEYDDDDVVADVAFAFELLTVLGAVGEERGDVEHDFVALPFGVDGLGAGGVV